MFLLLYGATEIAVYTAIHRHAHHLSPNPTVAKIQAKRALLHGGEAQSDILIFGDSSSAGAIQAAMVAERTGLTAFNFGMVGSAAIAGNAFLYEEYLRRHPPPRYIVMMNVFENWTSGYNRPDVRDLLTTLFIKDVIKTQFQPRVMDSHYLSTWLDAAKSLLLCTYRHKKHMRHLLNPWSHGEYNQRLEDDFEALKKQLLLARGSSLYAKEDRERVIRDSERHVKLVRENRFRPASLNTVFMNRMIAVSKQFGVKLILCYPPVHDAFHAGTRREKYIADYKDLINSFAQAHAHVHICGDDFFVAPLDELSTSHDHVNPKGARKVTARVIEKIMALERGE